MCPYPHALHNPSIRHRIFVPATPTLAKRLRANSLLELLLGPELVGVAALLLAAVDSARWQTSVALAADPAHLSALHLHG